MTILPRCSVELPDPARPFSPSLPSTTIEQANVTITRVRQDEAEKTDAKRGPKNLGVHENKSGENSVQRRCDGSCQIFFPYGNFLL